MEKQRLWTGFSLLVLLSVAGALSGCAHYEVNDGYGKIPGHYIRTELPQSHRAVESARAAGKDKACPQEFKEAEDTMTRAYDIFRECRTEEGAALANKASAMANALCPPQAQAPAPAAPEAEAPLAPVPAAEPAPGHFKYCVTLHGEFDIDRAVIRPEYKDEVAKVGEFMKKYPSTTAVIEGHTDDVGSDEHNMELSQARAEAVVNTLVESYGIDRSRLTAKGYGKTRPIADNATDEGRQRNRRIEAIIDCAFEAKEVQPPERLCMGLTVQFDTGSAAVKAQYRDEIAKVADYLKAYPTTTALIEGHTDNVGGYDYNMKLSQERAQGVVQYLVQNFGIDASRLSAKGYGYTRRLAYNNTAEGRAKNRRINAVIDCVVKK